MDLPLKNCTNIPSIDTNDTTKIILQQTVDAIQSTTTTFCIEKCEGKQSMVFLNSFILI